jgi:hypothetical protein
LRRLWRRVRIVATREGSHERLSLTPKDVKPLWNKGPAIWFPPLGRACCKAD